MQWTRTDTVRRWIVVCGLIAGPLLLVLSISINLTAPTDSLRADFDSMTAHPGLVVLEALLEAIGFMVVLAAMAGATVALRGRGSALGTWGAVLAMLGIVGFSFSNANGFTLAELAQLPDHDAGFATAGALMTSSTAGTVGTVGMLLEIAGQLGILLVIAGLIRARLVPVWLLLPVVAGIAINFVVGTMLGTLIADLLLLATGTWIAICLGRCSRGAWLGMHSAPPVPHSTVTA